jgi:hypothetical protein
MRSERDGRRDVKRKQRESWEGDESHRRRVSILKLDGVAKVVLLLRSGGEISEGEGG